MSVATLSTTTVDIERVANTADATGGNKEVWTLHVRLKASVQPLSGTEQFRWSREQEQVDGKAYFPGTPDITNRDRMRFKGKIAQIVAVKVPVELDRFTTVFYRFERGVGT